MKIPYKILQYVRENRFLPLYSGTNDKGVKMARWELDKIMEVRSRKQQRITRERKALTEELFAQLHNEEVDGNDG